MSLLSRSLSASVQTVAPILKTPITENVHIGSRYVSTIMGSHVLPATHMAVSAAVRAHKTCVAIVERCCQC